MELVILPTKCDFAEIFYDDVCYALICKWALFSLYAITSFSLHAVPNILQEYEDDFLAKMPSGLPPFRGIEYQIDLIPRDILPNCAVYRTNPGETKQI